MITLLFIGATIKSVPVAFAQTLNLAPDCSQATATPDKLWPPDNKLVPIQITGVTDPDNDAVTIETQCITQDEPVRFSRRERTRYRFDADGIGTSSPSVKAKRSGSFVSLPDGKRHQANGRIYDIIFKATDTQGAVCSGKVSIQVPLRVNSSAIDSNVRYPSAPNGVNCEGKALNNAPIIYSQPIVSVQVGNAYQYTVAAHDPDAEELIYSLSKAPNGVTIDSQTGNIQWTPSPAQEGVQALVVKVTDARGLSATQAFDVTVEKIPDRLTAAIVANPTSGSSPLTVHFSP